jgi:ethanolamine-phosphate cytidylyltransferase
VGILGDAIVNRMHGMNLPLMNLHERVLSVLGCRYVSDVLIDAPYQVSTEMIASLRITEVVHLAQQRLGDDDDNNATNSAHEARYHDAKAAGIFTVLQVETDFRIGNVIQRIQHNQAAFQAKFERKMKAEQDYIDTVVKAKA